jgi:Protein of unknown function (DUF1045)
MGAERARYAVYFVPREGTRLSAFGARWLGAVTEHAGFAIYGHIALTAAPRLYGFHATLKAPFYLSDGASEDDLLRVGRDFVQRLASFDIGRLRVERLDDFIALTPMSLKPELNELAASCVRVFEPMRAPLSQADRARRLAAGLDAREIAYLDAWGYPYVFDGFQFHMSLTGAVESASVETVRAQLAQAYAVYDEPVVMDAIAICRQPARAEPFEVWQRLAFVG